MHASHCGILTRCGIFKSSSIPCTCLAIIQRYHVLKWPEQYQVIVVVESHALLLLLDGNACIQTLLCQENRPRLCLGDFGPVQAGLVAVFKRDELARGESQTALPFDGVAVMRDV
eukprot:2562781-Rhodomonas_salina.1